MERRIIIAGGRDFNEPSYLRECMTGVARGGDIQNPMVVISGGARGADKMGENWGRDRNVIVRVYPADWDKYGKRAGYLRNLEMAKIATELVAFWDGRSRGTAHMIDIATKEGLHVHVFRYDNRVRYYGQEFAIEGFSDGTGWWKGPGYYWPDESTWLTGPHVTYSEAMTYLRHYYASL